MEEKREENVEEEEQTGEIVKFVEIRYGVGENGGGVQIIVRDDESDARTLTELTLRILRELNWRIEGKKGENPKEVF